MDPNEVQGLIERLHAARAAVAGANAALAEREIARQALKTEIVGELTSRGVAATPAEKAAGQDPRLIAFARDTIASELERDARLADAETLRFQVQLGLLTLEASLANAALVGAA
jgi:hypothetical protein